jgi:hypothetical protein
MAGMANNFEPTSKFFSVIPIAGTIAICVLVFELALMARPDASDA